jgi:hypothetical protein
MPATLHIAVERSLFLVDLVGSSSFMFPQHALEFSIRSAKGGAFRNAAATCLS